MTDYKEYYDDSYANQKTFKRSEERKLSNKAKSLVINNVLSNYLGDNTWVFDLCGGKGQDLHKWLYAYQNSCTDIYKDLVKYVNLDISKDGVDECKNRIVKMNLQKRFRAFEYDVFKNKLGCNIPKHLIDRPCIVSCQLALHYSFKSAEMFRVAMHNLLIMQPVAIFITYPDPDILINKGIRTFYSGGLDETDVVARVENLKFNPNIVFGNSYDYYQNGTCVSESIHEYIVNEELLYTTLYNNGYNLVYDNNHANILGGLHIVDIKSPVALYKSVIYTLY
tara:strand:+ start:60 stop:899 length:840 start_codon:yes stop_codon:yes gene_type:complete